MFVPLCVSCNGAQTTLVVFQQQERRTPLIFIVMLKTTETNVTTFTSAQFGELRTHQAVNGIIWFCLADVANALGLEQATRLKSRLNEKGVTTIKTLTKGGMQELNFIDEPNLYRCIFQSRKKEAEKFQSWVFEEVLPSIRKSGGYLATSQEDTPELIMARALQVAQMTIEKHQMQLQAAQKQIELQDEQIKQSAPKVQYVDNILQSVNTYTSTQMAKELGMREAEQLHKTLKERGIMFKQSGQWLLTAKYCEKGYTKPRTTIFTRSDGSQGTNTITVWTERGRAFLHNLTRKLQSA